MPDLSSLAGMFGGGGPGGAGGGMPDLATLMQNPQLMQMAQQFMSNGGMERMMANPALANLVSDTNLYLVCIGHTLKPAASYVGSERPKWSDAQRG